MLDEAERRVLVGLSAIAAGAPRFVNFDPVVDAACNRLEACGRAASQIVPHDVYGIAVQTDITSEGQKALRVDNIIRGLVR
jgi:hypothetical protein